ncbi:coiled-coil domain-containing protein [Bdellovibrio reynosensis]|uniref:Chromosome partition protein Smc n=1 Tax=Bdellovibrio reynosensis TaxID=2835041 RepID=A0ABY4CDH5_9BACT|nr:hypothetical protein [Bdellovibrio reynosensis]UOF02504.1 hypothetical protein MNR06_06010 [Bdellovibrio reynosensis]
MTRKNLFFLVIAFIIGVSVWLYHVNRGMKETQSVLIERAESLPRREVRLPVVVSNAQTTSSPAIPSAEKEQLATEILALQDQLAAAREAREDRRQTLEGFRSQQRVQTEQQRTPANFTAQVQNTGMQINDFVTDLQNFDRRESEINRKAEDLLKLQDSQAQAARLQIDEDIRNQESTIRQVEEQLNYWQNVILFSPEREARIVDLQSLINLQREQLELLRQERVLISSQVVANNQAVLSEKDQRLSEIAQQREDIQETINELRQNILAMEREQTQIRTVRNSILSQINRAQRDFEAANNRVKTIEASLKEKADQLSTIQ